MADVDQVADELYALPPAEFVAARDSAARAARVDGDRESATAIMALRKPTTTAWLVNLLVRADPGLADQLRTLGEGLRGAESSLAGAELKGLDKQRRQLVAGLVTKVRGLARAAGQRVTPASADEVSQTLLAALADPDAADEVLSGRLTHAREHVGFGAGRGGRAHLGLVPPLPAEPQNVPQDVPHREAERDAQKERRARERAEAAAAALAQAEQEHATALAAERDADTALNRSRATLGERTAETGRLADELRRLTERLEQVRAAEAEADVAVSELQGRHDRAAKALRWAVRDLDQAKAAVDRR